MITTVKEVSNGKKKVLNEFVFRSAPLVRFTAELGVRMHVSLVLNVYAHEQLFLGFRPLLCSPLHSHAW